MKDANLDTISIAVRQIAEDAAHGKDVELALDRVDEMLENALSGRAAMFNVSASQDTR